MRNNALLNHSNKNCPGCRLSGSQTAQTSGEACTCTSGSVGATVSGVPEPLALTVDHALMVCHGRRAAAALVDRGEGGDRCGEPRAWGSSDRKSSTGTGSRLASGQLHAWRQQLTQRMDGPPAGFARVDAVAAEREAPTQPVFGRWNVAARGQSREFFNRFDPRQTFGGSDAMWQT